MSLPLAGRVVALAESRQLDELAALLAAQGATPLSVPLVAILDPEDPAPVAAWVQDLAAGRFGYVVLTTGEGVRRLVAAADAAGVRDAAVEALGRTRTTARGPKPGQALRELGLRPGVVADAPTTAGLVATLAREPLAGQAVGVQVHGSDNPALVAAVEASGATAHPVRPYRYAPAADAGRVADLIGRLAAGGVDALVVTSSPQVDRLFEVAADRGLEADLRSGLERTAVAAVGPVAAGALAGRGVRVDVCPARGWVMKNLVLQIAREPDAGWRRPSVPPTR